MNTSSLFSNWWVALIQGILMIAVSILIFNNPGTMLLTLAFWLGFIVICSGLYGIASYFKVEKAERDFMNLLGSIAMVVIGFLMLSKIIISMIAITIAFGLLVSIMGLNMISGSWNARKLFPMWWITAILGVAVLITGIKSILDVESGAESISSLFGIAVLLSGIGLISFALMKRKIVKAVQEN